MEPNPAGEALITHPMKPEKRRLVRNLRAPFVFEKIREAERRMEAGERELGFYLLEVKARKLHRDATCTSFSDFVIQKTGISKEKATDLVRIAKALELLPLMDEAFSHGELYWTAVRAMSAVATPQTEAQWIEYAKGRRVNEVERRVAASKPGEDPRANRWGRSPVRYPYSFRVNAEVHQAFEALTAILSRKAGAEVTVEEALFLAAREKIEREIESDGKDGKERKLPSSYRLVLHECPRCKEHSVRTVDGRVPISEERARELLQGAEVLDLSEGQKESDVFSLEKGTTWSVLTSEVVSDPHTRKKSAPDVSPPKASSTPPLVKHAENLSTPERPSVPAEERDRPNTPELNKEVLSRDGYLCKVPGCENMAVEDHHIVFRSQGGRTLEENLAAFCDGHHPLTHDGVLLVSGAADELILSDKSLRPLAARAGDAPPSVELEVERPKQVGLPPEDGGEAESIEPSSLPEEITAVWWRKHRSCLEYSEKRNAWVFEALRDLYPSDGKEEPRAEKEKKDGASSELSLFVGQKAAVENLAIALKAAKLRGELPPPILLSGPPGLGKTTLASLVAKELDGRAHVATAPLLSSIPALIDILSGLQSGDVLFLDEIHGLPAPLAECLYEAIDSRSLSLTVLSGSRIRLLRLKLDPFLLVGATTEESLLPRPFHSRFAIRERLDFYSKTELQEIALREGGALGVEVSREAAGILASGSRGTPRALHGLLRRARDLAQIEAGSVKKVLVVDSTVSKRALESQGIDAAGLSRVDRKILEVLVSRSRPLGLRSLADLIGENPRTIAEIYEPYLLREGYLLRTHRGRTATAKAAELFKRHLRELRRGSFKYKLEGTRGSAPG